MLRVVKPPAPVAATPTVSARTLDRARLCRLLDDLLLEHAQNMSAAVRALQAQEPGAPSPNTLRRWHSAFRAGGVEGVQDRRRGRQRQAYGWEAAAIERWNSPTRPSAATVAYWLRCDGHDSASDSRVRRYLQSLPADVGGEDSKGRAGRHHRQQNVLPYVARDRTALDVGLIYQGDGHTCDVYVQHPSTGNPWRAELTVWMDVRSRYLAGWWLGEAESAVGTIHSLSAALLAHDHVPAAVHVDPGSGFRNRLVTDEVTGWLDRAGISAIFALPGNAKGKGDVEGWFRWFEERCGKRFPTYMQGRTDDAMRRLPKAIRDGLQVPSLAQYSAAVGAYVDSYNATPQQALGCAPVELWQRLERSPVELPEAALLRPTEPRKVTRGGITLHGRLYRHPALLLVANGTEVLVSYDLRDARTVWIDRQDGRRICEAALVELKPWAEPSRIDDLRRQRERGRVQRLERKLEEVRGQERPPVEGGAAAAAIEDMQPAALAPPEDTDFDPWDAV